MTYAHIAGADGDAIHVAEPLLEPKAFIVFVFEVIVDRGIVAAGHSHHLDEADPLWSVWFRFGQVQSPALRSILPLTAPPAGLRPKSGRPRLQSANLSDIQTPCCKPEPLC